MKPAVQTALPAVTAAKLQRIFKGQGLLATNTTYEHKGDVYFIRKDSALPTLHKVTAAANGVITESKAVYYITEIN
jgi:hypothetical protein